MPNRRDFLKIGTAFGAGALAGGTIQYFIGKNEIDRLKEALKRSNLDIEPTINVYNWYDYIAPGVCDDFSDEYGVEVKYTTYSNPDEMFAKIRAGGSGFDVVIASDYKVGEMVQQNLLQKLDYTKIRNFKFVSDKFRNPPFDQKQEYSVPYLWGTTGIGYNKDVVKENFEGFEIIFDESKISKYSKKVVLVDEMREVFAAALKYLGYSINDTNEDHLKQAKEIILKIKPYLLKFSAEQIKELLISGDAVLALGYSTDIYLASYQNESITYKIAGEGGTLWMDNLVLLNESKNVNASHKFIDYMLRPPIAAVNSNYLFIANPCKITVERGYVYPEIADDPNIYPPDEVMDKLEILRPFTQEERNLMGKLWSEIRA